MADGVLRDLDELLHDGIDEATALSTADMLCDAIEQLDLPLTTRLALVGETLARLSRDPDASGEDTFDEIREQFEPALESLVRGDGGAALSASRRRHLLEFGAAGASVVQYAYEEGCRMLVRSSVAACRPELVSLSTPNVPDGISSVVVEAPARMDLAGGWSDTPPISYEAGGAVLNVGLTVDGLLPFGACARVMPGRYVVRIEQHDLSRPVRKVMLLTLDDLESVQDYRDPSSFGSLCLSVLVSLGFIDPSMSAAPLADQLLGLAGGGLHLSTWSRLPPGSGLGGSSILASALVAAVCEATGRRVEGGESGLVAAVLHVEQLMTTGGGWQDQVGCIYPGIKMATSPPSLPLRVDVRPLDALPSGFIDRLERQMVLVYTGTTRLARNLLRSVLQKWFLQTADMIELVEALKQGAADAERACTAGDVRALGMALDAYWAQKKMLGGPSTEPYHVTRLMGAFRPHVWGQAMGGAGGGGFMMAITREPDMRQILEGAAEQTLSADEFAAVRFCEARIANVGLCMRRVPGIFAVV